MDYRQLDAARQTAQDTQTSALNYGARGITLADELRKAIGERFGESPIAKQAATARGEFLAQAPQARAESLALVQGGSILSPTQQQAIEASKRSAALVPLIGANTLQDAAFGTMEDLINAGTNAYSAEATRQQGLAELAQNNYSTLLAELFKKAEEQRAQELFPLQKQKLKADTQKAISEAKTGGSSVSLQPVEIGGQLYNFNSKTGEYTKANVKGSKGKYSDSEIADFANGVANGSMKITNVPAEVRGQVQTYVDQINSSKTSLWDTIKGWLGG